MSNTKVDHIGFRTASEVDYQAVITALGKVGLTGIESEVTGHRRTFFELGDSTRLEVQLWNADMPESRTIGIHVDIQSADPMKALQQVDESAEDWGEGEVPRGGVRVTSSFSIMARPIIK
ncbi:MAG: hypothetical protein WAV41_02805 [Microgenomates group bacterium]